MADHVAQRTLVKSPPELWAEVSEQRTLASRLEAFGEIRITRLDPETSVAWEGNDIRGTVELEPAGWGTLVTLRAAAAGAAASPGAPHETTTEAAPGRPPATDLLALDSREPQPIDPSGHTARRPGLFARMLARRRAARAAVETQAHAPHHTVATTDPTQAQQATEQLPLDAREPAAPDPLPLDAREPAAPEPPLHPTEPDAPTPEDLPPTPSVGAILTAVLDGLGSAHHRPYSRG